MWPELLRDGGVLELLEALRLQLRHRSGLREPDEDAESLRLVHALREDEPELRDLQV